MIDTNNISPSLRLQRAALRLAAQDGTSLDLESKVEQVDLKVLPPKILSEARNVTLLGAHNSRLLQMVSEQMNSQASLHIIENESAYLEEIRIALQNDYVDKVGWHLYQAGFEDLRTDPTFLADRLATQRVTSVADFQALEAAVERQRVEQPLVPSASMSAVILNVVLNRVTAERVKEILAEAARILQPGGYLMSLLVLADEPLSAELPIQMDGVGLWNLPQETALLPRLSEAGYYAMTYVWRASLPVKVVSGTELRTYLLLARSNTAVPHLDRGYALMYRGPWKEVQDEQGHRFARGERTAVSEEVYQRLTTTPYQQDIIVVPPYLEVAPDQAPPFDEHRRLRHPKVTKGIRTVFDQPAEGDDPSSEACCDNGVCN